jgi:hypothetical protein
MTFEDQNVRGQDKSDEWLTLFQEEQRIEREILDLKGKLKAHKEFLEAPEIEWQGKNIKFPIPAIADLEMAPERIKKELQIRRRAKRLIAKRRMALEARPSDQLLPALKLEKQGAVCTDAVISETKSESVSAQDKKAEPGQDTVGNTAAPRSPRGPKPKMESHRAIAAVVNRYGDNWQTESSLDKIAAELDRNKARTPPPNAWANRTPPAKSWKRAITNYPVLVKHAISYSLKMAARVSGN